jgi:signal peptidase I
VTSTAPSTRAAPLLPASVYRVPSVSMEPTLRIGARVALAPAAPRVGTIAVFYPPQGAEQEECGPVAHVVKLGGGACASPIPRESSVKFIKRIVAGPGDRVYISEGHVYRRAGGQSRFVHEADPYIRPCSAGTPACNFPTPITIPPGDWFMLGDNRGESDDSRFWGSIPTAWIVGVVREIISNGVAAPNGIATAPSNRDTSRPVLATQALTCTSNGIHCTSPDDPRRKTASRRAATDRG